MAMMADKIAAFLMVHHVRAKKGRAIAIVRSIANATITSWLKKEQTDVGMHKIPLGSDIYM